MSAPGKGLVDLKEVDVVQGQTSLGADFLIAPMGASGKWSGWRLSVAWATIRAFGVSLWALDGLFTCQKQHRRAVIDT